MFLFLETLSMIELFIVSSDQDNNINQFIKSHISNFLFHFPFFISILLTSIHF